MMSVMKQKEMIVPNWQRFTSCKEKKKTTHEIFGVVRLICMKEVKPVRENSVGLQ